MPDVAKWLLIAITTMTIATYFLVFTLDNELAMSQCLKHHSHDLCVYSLNR